MKLQRVPARTGWLWVQLGLRTFFKQPLGLTALFFLFMLAVSVLALLPLIGQALALALLPAATLAFMAATRSAQTGALALSAVLQHTFGAGRERLQAMAVLGALYAAGALLIMGLTTLLLGAPPEPGALAPTPEPAPTPSALPPGAEGVPPPTTGGPPPALPGTPTPPPSPGALMQQPEVLQRLWLSLLLHIPLGFLFWHAPALVHWHGVAPVKSLFFSLLACWNNKGALLLYFIGWAAVFFAVALALVLLGALLGGPRAVAMLLLPVALLMSAVFFSSLYFTFRDSFQTDSGQPPG